MNGTPEGAWVGEIFRNRWAADRCRSVEKLQIIKEVKLL